MASTRIVEEERGTYTGQIRPQHNGYWAGDFSASVPTPSGAPVPDPGGWRWHPTEQTPTTPGRPR